jgi:hypothetical protein
MPSLLSCPFVGIRLCETIIRLRGIFVEAELQSRRAQLLRNGEIIFMFSNFEDGNKMRVAVRRVNLEAERDGRRLATLHREVGQRNLKI